MKGLMPLLVAGAVLAGCGSTSPNATHTLTGQIIYSSSNVAFNRQDGKSCVGGDMGPIYPAGTGVKVITYAKHRAVAIGHLSASVTGDRGHQCEWSFIVKNVRIGAAYNVTAGSEVANIGAAQMQDMDWNLTLGFSASTGQCRVCATKSPSG